MHQPGFGGKLHLPCQHTNACLHAPAPLPPMAAKDHIKGRNVQDIIEPIIHKAAVTDLTHPLKNTGLSIGDPAELHLGTDGRIAVYVKIIKRSYLIRRRVQALIGYLSPKATPLLAPALRHGDHLRVRVVGLTPEHLATSGNPEMYISVWGTTRHFHARPPSAPLQPTVSNPS